MSHIESAEKLEKMTLPDGYLRLGEHAVSKLVQVMREEVINYNRAFDRAKEKGLFGEGTTHSDLHPENDPVLNFLPRYCELPILRHTMGTGTENPNDPLEIRCGTISNPTVHIALGQFRRVTNALSQRKRCWRP